LSDSKRMKNETEVSFRKDLIAYLLGGMLAWGLIGWGLDYLLQLSWMKFAGLALGAAGGFYLAVMHRKERAQGRDADPRT